METQQPNFDHCFHDDPPEQIISSCAQGHRSTLCLQTQEGGTICLLCFSNLLSNPSTHTVHVSYALSQLSIALSQPSFLRSLLSFHPHFLVSPLVHALSSFDDNPIALQIVDMIASLSSAGGSSVCAEFVSRVSDMLSSGALGWSSKQLYMLHCFGVLLKSPTITTSVYIKNIDSIVSNLVAGLQLPSEEIRGEILFILYRLSILKYESKDTDGADIFTSLCPKLIYLTLEALLKTQSDDVRLNCLALLTILAQQGLFGKAHTNDVSNMSSDEEDDFMQTAESGLDVQPLNILFAEAIKGPLLSTDSQVQISTLDLIVHYLSQESNPSKQIEVFLTENVVDYVFETLRMSECKDPVVTSCLRVLDLLSTAEQAFRQKLVVGFASVIPILRYVAEIPFHPVQLQTLKLVWNCVSNCPGLATVAHMEDIVLVLTGMLKRYNDGEIGLLPETFRMSCSIFVALLRTQSLSGILDLVKLVQDASKYAILASISFFEKDSDQIMQSLYLLREAYAYTDYLFSIGNSSGNELRNFIIGLCTSDLLPWFVNAANELNEEATLGVMEIFHSILFQNSDTQAKEFAKILTATSWFSFSFGCLGVYSTEKMRWRVYLMLSSLVDILLGNDSGKSIRDSASCLPYDPIDLLFLLGQSSSNNPELSSCQSAVFVIFHASSLYDDRLADDKLVLASLEQYILVNCTSLVHRSSGSSLMTLVNLYGLQRGLAKMSYQIPYSPEAERILFHILSENEWDLASAEIHSLSLKWLFQQEKISKPLSYQILNFCRKECLISNQKNTCGKNSLNVYTVAELVAAEDNYAAAIVVCLLIQLLDEEGQESDIIVVFNLMTTVIGIFPTASGQLCLHGVGNAIQYFFYNSIHSSSQQIFMAILPVMLNILRFGCPETLSNDGSWLAVTIKLIEHLVTTGSLQNWNHERQLIIGILSLILHYSSDEALTEASKSIVLNSSLASAFNSVIGAVCTKGPALSEYTEGTSMGDNLILLLLLYHFSLKCLKVVLPGLDWQSFFHPSNKEDILSTMHCCCNDLCRLVHFGHKSVKLVASYCLLELFTRSAQQMDKHHESKFNMPHLKSVLAVLEGLVFYSDIRVAMNCALCLSIVLGWDLQEGKVTVNHNWCRLIVEEMAMSLAVPCLASKSFMIHHKPAIHVTVALLKLQSCPQWMRTIFDDPCLSAIIENLTPANVSSEMVLLFRELLKAQFLNADQIGRLNHTFQASRKHMYSDGTEDDLMDEHHLIRDDPVDVSDYLIHLMSSNSSSSKLSDKRQLLDEIELFSRSSEQ